MKLCVIVQARLSSTRLPNKTLFPLYNSTVLEVMIERLKPFHKALIIATSTQKSDDPIIDVCRKNGIRFFRGSLENVLERFYKTAQYFGATEKTNIIRLTSDCPLVDAKIIQALLDKHICEQNDYTSNTLNRTFPRGLDIEVFSYKSLQQAYLNATKEFEKEHVTPFIYKTRPNQFKIAQFKDQRDFSKYRLTIDTQEDFDVVEEFISYFDSLYFSYEELIEVLKRHETLFKKNAHVEQKSL